MGEFCFGECCCVKKNYSENGNVLSATVHLCENDEYITISNPFIQALQKRNLVSNEILATVATALVLKRENVGNQYTVKKYYFGENSKEFYDTFSKRLSETLEHHNIEAIYNLFTEGKIEDLNNFFNEPSAVNWL